MRASVIQFDIKPGEVAINEALAEEYIEKAVANGAAMVVLPELWNCGYQLTGLPELAQNMRGSSVRLLQKLAKKHRLFIFGGTIAEKKEGNYYNTMVVINAQGDIVAKYRKIHLFPYGLEEEKYFAAGNDWALIETPWGKAGMMICYDLRFPELARNLVLRGARFLVLPAQWPLARLENWLVLVQARAVENQVFVLAANRTGRDESGKYDGGSLIVSPWGDILARGCGEEGAYTADLDFALIEDARSRIPGIEARRRILDEIDDSLL